MSVKYIALENLALDFIDGDRGKNYPNQSDFTDKGYCLFLSAKNVTEQGLKFIEKQFISEEKDNLLRAGRVKKNDVVMTTRGSRLGNVAYFNDELSLFNAIRINSGMIILRNKSDLINSEYLYYYLSSEMGKEQINMLRSGSAVPHFPVRDLKKIKIPKLPISIQNSVVSFFKKITQKIALNNQINETLEAMAQALFKSWFIDFDPVHAKANAKDAGLNQEAINRAAIKVISSKTDAELDALQQTSPDQYQSLETLANHFPDTFEDSELGMIPKGWEVLEAKKILKRLTVGKRYSKKNVNSLGLTPVYEQGVDILLGFHNDEPNFQASANDPHFIFGDHTCITHLISHPFSVSQNVIPIKGNKLSTYWVYYAIQGKQVFQEYKRHWGDLLIKKIVKPANSILIEKFGERINSIHVLKEANLKENRVLSELRDTLLPKLLSGEINVNDI